ncbi:cell division topological specificity factor MinE [Deinococcus roseus]|uniref:Cell division topological specificity factor n=1 Tax=Deinococcus roseus TaxID=392414 RepID=A0ABQ2CXK3_9DEIO|nr:cell division topological specificity factor MinE [Deinococcus roseus]GGJ31016.1 hypothetical protein GCM10008938_16370 [Deinococcus roseus]
MFWGRKNRTKETLKNRLELVLAYDRAQIPPGRVEALRKELLEVVERYFPKNTSKVQPNIEVEQRGDTVVLTASIPLDNQ